MIRHPHGYAFDVRDAPSLSGPLTREHARRQLEAQIMLSAMSLGWSHDNNRRNTNSIELPVSSLLDELAECVVALDFIDKGATS